VVNLETGEPIRNAMVTVSKTPTPQEINEFQEGVKAGPRLPFLSKSVLSGVSGEYQFTGLPAGHYVVNAQKPGFAARFNVEGLQRVQIDLSASAGNIVVKLSPLGVIEGTVTDQNGEPVDSVKIEAYTARIEAGVRSITSNHSAVCNDRGGFRIWGLEPGQYYLKAAGRNGGTYFFLGQGTPRPSSWLSFVPVYAGGGRTFDSTTPIAIAAGTQARADFRINLVPSATIRGVLENYTLHQRVTFSLRQDGEELADDSRVNLSGTAGRFEITAVPPGDYILTAVEGQMARGEIPVHVSESGINGLSMPLWPAVTVTGVVHNIGPAPEQSKKAAANDDDAPEFADVKPGCQVFLKADTGHAAFVSMFAPQAETFSIPNVFAGGKKVTSVAWTAHTDDLGNYRVGPVAAGTYYLVATAEPWYMQGQFGTMRAGEPGLNMAYPTTYYPATTDAGQAGRLKVESGGETQANLAMPSVQAVTVHADCAAENCNGSMSFYSVGVGGLEALAGTRFFRNSVPIEGIAPGRYVVRVTGQGGSMRKVVDLAGGEATVSVIFQPSPKITGVVTYKNGIKPHGTPYVTMVNETTNTAVGLPINSDGIFEYAYPPIARFRPVIGGVAGFFISQMSASGAEIRDGAFELMEGSPVELKIEASDESGRLKGLVMNGDKPAPGVLVVLAPRERATAAIPPRGFQTDSDGSYDFTNVPAGDYLLFTADRMDLEYANAKAVEPYLASATPVRIESHQVVTEKLSLPGK
jgi:hypothetical protein